MAIFDFPGTNFHELNLDWLLDQMKNCLAEWETVKNQFTSLQEYITHYFDTHMDELYAQLDAKTEEELAAINTQVAALIASIPQDYSALSATVRATTERDYDVPLTVDEYYSTVDGRVTADSQQQYLRSSSMIVIDDAKPMLVVSDYSGIDRIDAIFWDSTGTFISKTTVYQYFINVPAIAPTNAYYVGFNIRSTLKTITARLVAFGDIVTLPGYVTADGTIMQGIAGNSAFKMIWRPVSKGTILKTDCKVSNTLSAIAFYDQNMTFISSVRGIHSAIDEYLGIAPQDGYAIASSITSTFANFALNEYVPEVSDMPLTFSRQYPYYIKNGALSATETYNVTNAIYVPAGHCIIIYASASSGADVVTDAQTNTSLVAGVTGSYVYWYSYYAAAPSIIRLCGRNDMDTPLTAAIIKPKKELNGATLYAIGDSYIAGNNLGGSDGFAKNHVWVNILALRNNATLMNYGANGTTIAECAAMAGTGTAPDSANVAISDRIDHISSDFDVIIFEGGRNDFNNDVPIGTISIQNTDRTTFAGAVQYIINTIISKNPNAIIIGHPCWVSSNGSVHATTGLSQTDYLKAFMDVCALNGIRVIDTTRNGIAVTRQPFREAFFMTATDVSHLNAEGHRRYTPYVENQFN